MNINFQINIDHDLESSPPDILLNQLKLLQDAIEAMNKTLRKEVHYESSDKASYPETD